MCRIEDKYRCGSTMDRVRPYYAGKYRFPSEQRSQTSSGTFSTEVGDHSGTACVVLFLLTTNTDCYRSIADDDDGDDECDFTF